MWKFQSICCTFYVSYIRLEKTTPILIRHLVCDRTLNLGCKLIKFIYLFRYLLNHKRKDSKYIKYHTCFLCDGLGKVTVASSLPVSRKSLFVSSQTSLAKSSPTSLSVTFYWVLLDIWVESFALTSFLTLFGPTCWKSLCDSLH